MYAAITAHVITTLNHHLPDSPGQHGTFRASMERDGFVPIGAGHFSMAFVHAAVPGKVIKVGIRGGDTAPLYLAWCRRNKLPYLPAVYALEKSRNYHVAVLDRLRPLDAMCDEDGRSWRNIRSRITSSLIDPTYGGNHRAALEKHFKGISDTCLRIGEAFSGFRYDLHPANMMVDSNNMLVVTDPISFDDDLSQEVINAYTQALGLC